MHVSIPNILFKYVGSADAVINLLHGRLKFATISQLNDPCEMLADFDDEAVTRSLGHMRETGYSADEFVWLHRQGCLLRRLAPEAQAIPVPPTAQEASQQVRSPFYNDVERMRRLHRHAVERIRAQVGVLSLAASLGTLPMWAHYAKNAAGIVVVFRDLDKVFCGDDSGSLSIVRPVQYSGEFRGMTFVPSSQDNLFFWKHSDWSYECEHRVVFPLAECTPSNVTGETIHLRQIDVEHVIGVIFGWRAEDEDCRRIEQAARAAHRHVELRQAMVPRSKVEIGPPIS